MEYSKSFLRFCFLQEPQKLSYPQRTPKKLVFSKKILIIFRKSNKLRCCTETQIAKKPQKLPYFTEILVIIRNLKNSNIPQRTSKNSYIPQKTIKTLVFNRSSKNSRNITLKTKNFIFLRNSKKKNCFTRVTMQYISFWSF